MSSRRDFLKGISLAVSTGSILAGSTMADVRVSKTGFNMSGFAAPKLDRVRIAYVGLGNRGSSALKRVPFLEGVDVVALCDKDSSCTDKAKNALNKANMPEPAVYTDSPDVWKEMFKREDIDLVYIATPWELHTPMAVYAMEQGKHAAVEVPAATTIDECWQLVKTSERTRKHCIQLENCCYDTFEMLTLSMARQGAFGDIIHGEGAYIHQLVSHNFGRGSHRKAYSDMWRLEHNSRRNGNLYPTHGLGPICQCMDINRGDRMEYMTSMSSNDFTMNAEAKKRAKNSDFYKKYVDRPFRGNINTSIVRTSKGRTIMIQHDVSSPRPYSRIHMLSGTKAFAQKYPKTHVAFGHREAPQKKIKELHKKYAPEIITRIGDAAKKVGGHGGMDFLMDWSIINSLRNGLPVDMDCYDAALWSSITPLSIESVANRSNSVNVPDFTRGNWKKNKPVALELKAVNGVRQIEKANAKEQMKIDQE